MAFWRHGCTGLVFGLVLFGLAGCGPSGGGPDPYEIPDEDKQDYGVDCGAYCAAEAVCLAAPEDSTCDRSCPRYVDKGALQAVYLDTRATCVQGLGATCDQAGLDDCLVQALGACQPGPGLETYKEAWCRRWLSCNGSPVDRYLQRCLDEFTARPDHAMYACFSEAAFGQFTRCLDEATCAQVIDFPMLTVCEGIYL